MTRPEELRGIDYAWCAIDRDGHVAVFTTAGAAPVPHWIDPAWNDAVLDAIEALPERGEYRLEARDVFRHDPRSKTLELVRIGDEPIHDGDPAAAGLRDWRRWARLGLFAYDWVDVHRPHSAQSQRYELIAAPTNPIAAAGMPSALVSQPRLDGVCFANARLIDVAQFL